MSKGAYNKIILTDQQKQFLIANYHENPTVWLAQQINVKTRWLQYYFTNQRFKREKNPILKKYHKKVVGYPLSKIAEVLEDYRNSDDKSLYLIAAKHNIRHNTLSGWIKKYFLPTPPSETTVIITLKSKV